MDHKKLSKEKIREYNYQQKIDGCIPEFTFDKFKKAFE